MNITPTQFEPEWPPMSLHLLRRELPPASALDVASLLSPNLSNWVLQAAESKGCPPDFVLCGLLAAASAALGNARWVSPWGGWKEPPTLWTMAIGAPSAGKSPGLDASFEVIKRIQNEHRMPFDQEHAQWQERADVAQLAEKNWKKEASKALADGEEVPAKPEAAFIPIEPRQCCYIVNDTTIERLAEIASQQPRGVLQARDELSGWLGGMTRYSESSDRPFWLEAYGGRSYAAERKSRPPIDVENLTVSVSGGIQPDPLHSLLMKSGGDDGLLARFLLFWPDPIPPARPKAAPNDAEIDRLFKGLYALELAATNDGVKPVTIHSCEEAAGLFLEVKRWAAEKEQEERGLMVSWLGKCPGFVVRLSLLLSALDAVECGTEPTSILACHVDRAFTFIKEYALPMARRAYDIGTLDHEERGALRLLAWLKEGSIQNFSSRQVLQLGWHGLKKAAELDPVLKLLEDHGFISSIKQEPKPHGGRPEKRFLVNPELLTV